MKEILKVIPISEWIATKVYYLHTQHVTVYNILHTLAKKCVDSRHYDHPIQWALFMYNEMRAFTKDKNRYQ